MRQTLKRTAVPSVFQWTPSPKPAARARARAKERCKRRALLPPPTEEVPDIGSLDVAEEVVMDTNDPSDIDSQPSAPPVVDPSVSSMSQTDPESKALLAIEKISHDDDHIALLTGLESYAKFKFVLQTLGPAANDLDYRWSKSDGVSVENQFLLTIMKLRKHYSNQELAMFFAISDKTVSNIFTTWLNFMYFQWRELDIWPSKDLVAFFTPSDFNKKFPHTRTIVDGTEIHIRKPKAPDAQQKTWPAYKNANTLKVLIGCTPGGMVNYASDAYGGSASDRLLCERSPLMTICDPGDVIMSDKGFNVQDMFAPYDISINIPTFMTGKNQLSAKDLAKDQQNCE